MSLVRWRHFITARVSYWGYTRGQYLAFGKA